MDEMATSHIGINDFADWTNDEKNRLMDFKVDKGVQYEREYADFNQDGDLPLSIDWRNKIELPVCDKGVPGSSTAISAVSTVESALFESTGRFTSLSFFNVLDCAGKTIDTDDVFKYIKENPLDTSSNYPISLGHCGYKPALGVGKIKDYKHIKPLSEGAMMTAVAEGPVFAAVEADKAAFSSYTGGIITSKDFALCIHFRYNPEFIIAIIDENYLLPFTTSMSSYYNL